MILKYFRKNWFPDLISRVPYENWVSEGKKDLAMRANERIKNILETHLPKALDEKIRIEVKRIVGLNEN